MKVLIAPDKFKGSLTSAQAASAIQAGMRRVRPHWRFRTIELSDGGEGFVHSLVKATGGRKRYVETTDAVGRPIRACYGILGDGKTAVIGLTEAGALASLSKDLRNPLRTTNEGTGALIRHAVEAGYRKLIVGLGGSATTDGGVGLAAALGWRFLDNRSRDIPLTGGGLAKLQTIVPPEGTRHRLRVM